MPLVPNFKPAGKIKPNLEMLAILRTARITKERRLKQPKIDKMREEYKLNNPHYWLEHSKYNTQEYATNKMDEITLRRIKKFVE